MAMKDYSNTPALSDITRFGDTDTLRSPQQDSVYSMGSSDIASPSTLAAKSPNAPIFSALPLDGDDDPFSPSFRRPERTGTVFSTSTQMSTDSVRSIRARLSVSTSIAKQVTVLLHRLTITGADPIPSPHRAPSDLPSFRRGQPIPHPGTAVPGDFIVSRRYVQSCQMERHFAKHLGDGKCWCAIFDEASDVPDSFFLVGDNEWCERAANVLSGSVDPACSDDFGNTPLHLFATLESPKGIEIVLNLVESQRVNPMAVNKAGQSFLHVLSAIWFMNLDDYPGAPLYRLLSLLSKTHFGVVFLRDVYGRTFFHLLNRYVDDMQIFNGIFLQYKMPSLPRDAFGVQPPSKATDQSFSAPRRMGTTPLSPLVEEVTADEALAEDVALMKIVDAAYTDPTMEDDKGRNGLHCLAEIRFQPPSPSNSPDIDPSSPNPCGVKRKRSTKAKPSPDDPAPINRHVQFLSSILTPVSKINPPDVNHYNYAGYTVLMNFAAHLADDTDDKAGKNIHSIVDLLLDKGADIHGRNRRGETALHVAAKLGHKHVVNKLMERGANLHARDRRGRDVLGVIDAAIEGCARNLPLYGRLEAARALVAKKLEEVKGEEEPGFVNEWCRGPGVA